MEPKNEILDKYVIQVKPFEQQTSWSCGPASIRTVLFHDYGIDLTDRELGLMFGSSDKNGTSDFEYGLKMMGFKFRQTDHGTLNKLKSSILKGYLPIIHIVMSDGGGHYVVVCGFDNECVYISDPAIGKIVKYGIPFFMGIWKEEETEEQTRWFLIITGYTKNRINTLIKKLKNIKRKIEN